LRALRGGGLLDQPPPFGDSFGYRPLGIKWIIGQYQLVFAWQQPRLARIARTCSDCYEVLTASNGSKTRYTKTERAPLIAAILTAPFFTTCWDETMGSKVCRVFETILGLLDRLRRVDPLDPDRAQLRGLMFARTGVCGNPRLQKRNPDDVRQGQDGQLGAAGKATD
jgi:hypothetical protein